jgi:hypothetical protein
MKDLRIIQPYTLLSFESITREGNFFRVKGPEDYRSVVMAVINDFVIEDLAMYSRDLLIYVPTELDASEDIRYVALISEETVTSDETVLRIGLGVIPGEIEGIDRLIQLFVKVLFQTPGTDIYHKTIGGGLLRIRRNSTISGDYNAISSEIAAAIRKADQDVKAMQAGLTIPSEEKLVSTEILRIRPDPNTQDINVLLALKNLSGSREYFNVAA